MSPLFMHCFLSLEMHNDCLHAPTHFQQFSMVPSALVSSSGSDSPRHMHENFRCSPHLVALKFIEMKLKELNVELVLLLRPFPVRCL